MARRSRWMAAAVVSAVVCAGCGRGGAVVKGFGLPVYQMELVDANEAGRLVRGMGAAHGGWRWTEKRFAVRLDVPPDRPVFVTMDAAIGQELMGGGPVELTARVNGVEVGRKRYARAERFMYSQAVAEGLLKGAEAEVEFEVDRTFEGEGGKALGLMAVSVGLSNIDAGAEYRAGLKERTRAAYERARRRASPELGVEEDRALMSVFHETPIWRSFRFHAIEIQKNPLDLWNMQELIWRLRPDYIIETGTLRGGSALFWANTLRGAGLTGSRVLTVDIWNFNRAASRDPLWGQYVEFVQGSSTDPAVVERIAKRVKGKKTLVVLDSDHSAPHVLRELRMYAGLVSAGSYMVVEDTEMDGVPTYAESFPGPMAAVTLFLAEGGERLFEVDAGREQFGITYNPGGWLRRK